MTAISPLFAFTTAEVADEGLIAAKRIGRNPEGSLWKSHYDHPARACLGSPAHPQLPQARRRRSRRRTGQLLEGAVRT